ncbi:MULTISPECIES: hypothetical protein [Nitrobacteraceae]|uniref:Uncharacterized protein n=1 Tax=Afipia massiliensis TaxID=211460 RepID=A0A840N2K2_9BRAD|nr:MULTISPECIES: hypothetical protein [Nitrobacteraceae]MBB5052854.1 hypothetical protein [Afipia massiliensis]MCF2522043.1 hypothetical protein [Bradyrhizobium sp. G127]MDO8978190.1 hypothetical protein [Afipia sp.]
MVSRSSPILGRVIDSLTAWLAHRRDIGELSHLPPGEFSSIASDLRLSPTDFARLAGKRRGKADNLCRLLSALGIDNSAIARTEPAVMRDMERVCAACLNTAICQDELRAGTAARTYQEFCANSGTLDVLDREERLPPAPARAS